MIWVLTLGFILCAVVVAISAAALVEVFRQLADIRTALDLQDEPMPLGVKSGELRTDDVGLPREIAIEPQALVVFLSGKCLTCLAVAESFRGGSSETVWFVLTGVPVPASLIEMLSESAERVIIDENDAIAARIGMHVTPAAFITTYGEITRAFAVTTPRQVQRMIPAVFTGPPESLRAQAVVGGGHMTHEDGPAHG